MEPRHRPDSDGRHGTNALGRVHALLIDGSVPK